MFIIDIQYIVPLEEVESFLNEHISFLDHYYNTGHFIASGRKNPRTGGIILCLSNARDEVEKLIKEDPFYDKRLANYTITEFIPSKYSPKLATLLSSD